MPTSLRSWMSAVSEIARAVNAAEPLEEVLNRVAVQFEHATHEETAPRFEAPDNPASVSYPIHMMCRREHITHYENLANLDQVVNTRFTFAGFPLKLLGAHGGPTRAVALVG